VRVWLDDVRDSPDGWVHVKTPEQAIELLRLGEVEEISLDHDLGLATPDSERTGYDVLAWLEQVVATNAWEHRLPVIRIHSANPVGWRRMEQAIKVHPATDRRSEHQEWTRHDYSVELVASGNQRCPNDSIAYARVRYRFIGKSPYSPGSSGASHPVVEYPCHPVP
jgi:hypothetical protein